MLKRLATNSESHTRHWIPRAHSLTCCKYMKVNAQESWGHMSTFGRATHVPPVRGCCIVFASARPVLAAEFHGVLKTALAGSVAVMKPWSSPRSVRKRGWKTGNERMWMFERERPGAERKHSARLFLSVMIWVKPLYMHDTLFSPFLVLVKELNQGQEIRELVTGRSEVEAGVIFHSLSEESGRTVCFIEQHLNLRDEEMQGGGQS